MYASNMNSTFTTKLVITGTLVSVSFYVSKPLFQGSCYFIIYMQLALGFDFISNQICYITIYSTLFDELCDALRSAMEGYGVSRYLVIVKDYWLNEATVSIAIDF